MERKAIARSIIRARFSRGNIGIREFDNPLLEAIADAIQARYEDALEHNPTLNTDLLKSILKSLNETSIKYSDFGKVYEVKLVWRESSEVLEVSGLYGVSAYVVDEYTICVLDRNIRNGASWGCDSIKLICNYIPYRLEKMMDEVQRALKHNRYELSFDLDTDSSIAFVLEGLDDVVDREEVKKIFDDIKEYLSGLEPKLFYDEIPIISNNPFTTAPEVHFDWDISSDGEIRFEFSEVYSEGASHRRSVFEVIFSPVDEE
ncbi:MAG: hypothetical protein KatS3mg087_0051 [Patescibacteria group bacterium]|nr:MAG: hypothetical protein KatS3mg087_0051 [Patescibacteria group bacterium]